MKTVVLISAMLFPGFARAQVASGVVTGQLFSREGQPSAGVRISAMAEPEPNVPISSASSLMSFAQTDATGRYRLENLPPGRYYIIAGLLESPTYYPGSSSLSGATAISVTAGATVNNINFRLVVGTGVTVSGRVIRPPNQQLTTQRVALLGNTPLQETSINPDGSFQFARVRPGSYTLVVGGGTMSVPVTVVVADKDVTGVEAVILPTGQVTGNVVVEQNGLIPRFVLSFSAFKGGISPSTAFLMPNGTFQGVLPEGEYRFGWSGLPRGYQLKSIVSGGVDLLTNPLRVSAGSHATPVTVTLGIESPPPWVKVSGRIKGITSGTGTRTRIGLGGSTTLETLEVDVNADGSFEFPRVLPGSYTTRFIPPVPVPTSSIVVPARDVDDLEIVLPALKEASGRVVVEGIGAVAPRLSFAWTTPSASAVATLGAGTVSVLAITQPDGTFKVTLPEGERRVTLNVPGYTVRSLTYGSVDLIRDPLRITGSDNAEFRVTLVPSRGAVGVGGGVLGGVLGGVVGGVPGGVLGSILASPPPPPPSVPPPATTSGQVPAPFRIRQEVAQENLISSTPPRYPELARAARVQGVVLLQAVISKEGAVENLAVISGHALLNEAAIEAVKQWRYKPQLMNGQPIPVVTTITVNFSLQ